VAPLILCCRWCKYLAEKENSSFGRFFLALMGGTDGKTIVSLRLPSAPSRKMADGKTAQDGARRHKTAQDGIRRKRRNRRRRRSTDKRCHAFCPHWDERFYSNSYLLDG
jgi:hypothetical protein